MFVAGVGLDQAHHDGRVEVAVVFELGAVQRLKEARLGLRWAESGAGHHDVVASAACHQLGVERLVGLKGVVIDLDTGFFLKGRNHALGNVVRPVVDVEDFLLGGRRRHGSAGCGSRRFFFFAAGGQSQRGDCCGPKVFIHHGNLRTRWGKQKTGGNANPTKIIKVNPSSQTLGRRRVSGLAPCGSSL